MKSEIKDIVFVFGNPITKIQSMMEEYNVSVVGTNSPERLIKELSNANDASQYFFIITEKEELEALNDVFLKLKAMEEGEEPDMFVIIDKKLLPKLKPSKNKIYVREYEKLTESVVSDLVISTTVHNQVQYYVERRPEPVKVLTKDKMERINRTMNNLDHQNALQGIKSQFGEIKKNQEKLTISKLILNSDSEGAEINNVKIETQEFLKEKLEEIKSKLEEAEKRGDVESLEDLMLVVYELLNMRSEDLKESSSLLVKKILEEEIEKGRKVSEESKVALEEIESTLLDEDKKEVEFLVEQRNTYMEKLKRVEDEVNSRVETVTSITNNYLKDLKQNSLEMLTGKYKNYLPVNNRAEFQETYKSNGSAIQQYTVSLVEASKEIIDDLQQVVGRYNNLMKLDTSIIETQKRLVDTLSTQKVMERVEYSNPLSVKLNLLISPTPNLGVSTMLKVFKERWERLLIMDFRETLSDPDGFKLLEIEDLMKTNLEDFKNESVKINAPLAGGVNEEQLKSKLEVIESEFDAIFIVVDKYMSVGLDLNDIQRVMYLTDTADKNLLEVNRLINTYEPLFEKLNKRMVILNKVTYLKKQNMRNMMITAGVDLTKVKVNIVDVSTELIDGDETVYKNINSNFNYF